MTITMTMMTIILMVLLMRMQNAKLMACPSEKRRKSKKEIIYVTFRVKGELNAVEVLCVFI